MKEVKEGSRRRERRWRGTGWRDFGRWLEEEESAYQGSCAYVRSRPGDRPHLNQTSQDVGEDGKVSWGKGRRVAKTLKPSLSALRGSTELSDESLGPGNKLFT